MPRQDPRLLEILRTANQAVLDRAIRHALFLERLKTTEVDDILRFFDRAVLPRLLDRLNVRLGRIKSRGFDLGPTTSIMLRDAITSANEIIRAGVLEASQALRGELVRIGHVEGLWQVRALEDALPPLPIDVDLTSPSLQAIRGVLANRPMHGDLYATLWSRMGESTARRLQSEITTGFNIGESLDEIVRRVMGTRADRFGASGTPVAQLRNAARATTRAAVNHVATQAREIVYEENGDLIKGVRFVATLDLRTTHICMSLDGQVFPVNEGPRPPLHPGCRSTTAPEIRSFRELGFDRDELAPGTRAALRGETPETTTFDAWLKTLSNEEQNIALGGPSLGQAFRDGRLDQATMRQILNGDARPITLADLEKLEGM